MMDEKDDLSIEDGVMMDEREELEETLELLQYAFEELKEIRDSINADLRRLERYAPTERIQELIEKIGKQLGEF